MSKSLHTSGPWLARVSPNDGEWEVIKASSGPPSGDPWFVCFCMDSADDGSAEGNARLIAAAPELLALARMVVRRACSEELSTHVEISFEPQDAAALLSEAERLTAKAEGRAP